MDAKVSIGIVVFFAAISWVLYMLHKLHRVKDRQDSKALNTVLHLRDVSFAGLLFGLSFISLLGYSLERLNAESVHFQPRLDLVSNLTVMCIVLSVAAGASQLLALTLSSQVHHMTKRHIPSRQFHHGLATTRRTDLVAHD